MADTRVQLEAEDWVRRHWLPEKLGQQFRRERVRLSSGGVFDFDAVSADDEIVVTISTSSARTASGKNGVGKIMKVRSDLFFLLLASCRRRIAALTESDMFDAWRKEAEAGRVPKSIEFVHVELPEELNAKLKAARLTASVEVSPR